MSVQTRVRYFVAGLVVGILLLSVGLGKANAYTKAKHVVYSVFPPATAPAALRVVGCETGHTYSPRAHNRSGASGLFQIMPFHVASPRRLFEPWFNVRVALRLSHGGRDWSPWECKP